MPIRGYYRQRELCRDDLQKLFDSAGADPGGRDLGGTAGRYAPFGGIYPEIHGSARGGREERAEAFRFHKV